MRLSRSTLKTGLRGFESQQTGAGFPTPPCLSHPLSARQLYLSHANDGSAGFWIDHCKASRRVSPYFGLNSWAPSVMNIWVPDGIRILPLTASPPRQITNAQIVIGEKLDPRTISTPWRAKLFGIGTESYTVGSTGSMGLRHQPSDGAVPRCRPLPIEVISDQISAAMLYIPRLLLQPPGALGRQRPRGAAG